MHRVIAAVVAVAVLAAPFAALAQAPGPAGARQRGARLIAHEGCGTCHTIPGIPDAHGMVGPPLGTIGVRVMIAGMLPNTPPNLIKWLMSPQSVVPGNAMPDMGLSASDAADIAAYLYTLR